MPEATGARAGPKIPMTCLCLLIVSLLRGSPEGLIGWQGKWHVRQSHRMDSTFVWGTADHLETSFGNNIPDANNVFCIVLLSAEVNVTKFGQLSVAPTVAATGASAIPYIFFVQFG